MKIGNISQTVLKRSVLKQLHTKREEALFAPSVEEMCSGVQVAIGQDVIFSSTIIYGDEKDLGCYGIAKTVNDIASRNGMPIGVEIVIQLPPYAYESRLKAMVAHMESCCQEQRLQILGVKASVCPVIKSAMISVTAVGTVEHGKVIQTHLAKSDKDIVLIGSVGTEGALRIWNKKRIELEERFIPSFLTALEGWKPQLFIGDAIHRAIEQGANAIHQLGDGGILAGLWELGEAGNLGLEIEMKKMTIRQDVIEVCEFVGVNPYQLSSTGSALVVIEDGASLVESLRQSGVVCAVIGRTTSGNERVIFNGGEKRFLDRPSQGELAKMYEEIGEIDD